MRNHKKSILIQDDKEPEKIEGLSDLRAYTRKFQVHVERHAWSKMFGWCKAATTEVSGMFMARIEGFNIIVYDVFFPKQYCSSGFTLGDGKAIDQLKIKLIKEGKKIEDFRGWWHTHYNFDVFWSGQDEETARRFSDATADWHLAIVINQKGEYKCRLDFSKPFDLTIDDIPIYLIKNRYQRKRKRNFKDDIKKWVLPMEEEPGRKAMMQNFHQYNANHFPNFNKRGGSEGFMVRDPEEEYAWWNQEGFCPPQSDASIDKDWEKQKAKFWAKQKQKASSKSRRGNNIFKGPLVRDAFGDRGVFVCVGGKVIRRDEAEELMMEGF